MVQSYLSGGGNVSSHEGTLAQPGEYDWTCVSSVHPSPQPERQIDRFSRFCTDDRRVSVYFTIIPVLLHSAFPFYSNRSAINVSVFQSDWIIAKPKHLLISISVATRRNLGTSTLNPTIFKLGSGHRTSQDNAHALICCRWTATWRHYTSIRTLILIVTSRFPARQSPADGLVLGQMR